MFMPSFFHPSVEMPQNTVTPSTETRQI